jgi:hypothetical protein
MILKGLEDSVDSQLQVHDLKHAVEVIFGFGISLQKQIPHKITMWLPN